MKKRHQQKLAVLSIALFVLFNAPVLLLFNKTEETWGFPVIYIYIFAVWFLSAVLSLIIFRKYSE